MNQYLIDKWNDICNLRSSGVWTTPETAEQKNLFTFYSLGFVKLAAMGYGDIKEYLLSCELLAAWALGEFNVDAVLEKELKDRYLKAKKRLLK